MSELLAEHEVVVLTRNLPDEGIWAGDVGVVVLAHPGRDGIPPGYTVEVTTVTGETEAVIYLTADAVRPASERDARHAGTMAPARNPLSCKRVRGWYHSPMIDTASLFLHKALESLAGAESETVNGRYNNAANRAYYASFQAAICALSRAGLTPRGDEWSHSSVPASFDGELINHRKLYAAELRGVLARNQLLRLKADYHDSTVSQTEANRALRRTIDFVLAVRASGGGSR